MGWRTHVECWMMLITQKSRTPTPKYRAAAVVTGRWSPSKQSGLKAEQSAPLQLAESAAGQLQKMYTAETIAGRGTRSITRRFAA